MISRKSRWVLGFILGLTFSGVMVSTVFSQQVESGRCMHLTTLLYHHVLPEAVYRRRGLDGLSVTPESLRGHIQYLKSRGYAFITMDDLQGYFWGAGGINNKSVLFTFDDAYDDFYKYAYPILKSEEVYSAVMVPTELVGEDGYLTWEQIGTMKKNKVVEFYNHTKGHKQLSGLTLSKVYGEVFGAEMLLREKGLGGEIFSYPYGDIGGYSGVVLRSLSYDFAFSTRHDNFFCESERLSVPRVHAGNWPLSNIGL